MRPRTVHFACLLLLLSSLAVSNVRAGVVHPSRTPGDVFVRNLLLQAAVEESEPATCGFGREEPYRFVVASQPIPSATFPVLDAVAQTAHVHAVTGSSL